MTKKFYIIKLNLVIFKNISKAEFDFFEFQVFVILLKNYKSIISALDELIFNSSVINTAV